MTDHKQLILFDIDGTLVHTTREDLERWRKRMGNVFRHVFGKEIESIFDPKKINGKVERAYFWQFARAVGISREEFDKKFPIAAGEFYEELKQLLDSGEIRYLRIDDAFRLVTLLQKSSVHHVGLITGNIEKNAWLKLHYVRFDEPFSVGGFGDELEDRGELVRHTIKKAAAHFGMPFDSTQTIVIGDTVHDIAAAKKAKTKSIGVASGFTDSHEMLVRAGADLVVDSLMDERVLTLLGLHREER